MKPVYLANKIIGHYIVREDYLCEDCSIDNKECDNCDRHWKVDFVFKHDTLKENIILPRCIQYWDQIFYHAIELQTTNGFHHCGELIAVKVTGSGKKLNLPFDYFKSLENIDFNIDGRKYTYKELSILEAI